MVPSRVTASVSTLGRKGLKTRPQHTLHLLALLVAYISRNLHCVANQGIPAGVVHSALNRRLILDDIHSQPSSFRKGPELVIYRLRLDGIERNERRLA